MPHRLLSLLNAKGKWSSLDFTSGFMPARLAVTRASSAWYFNYLGVLTEAPNNVPRFDYKFNVGTGTWEPTGLLIEGQRTNTLFPSNSSGSINNSAGASITYSSASGMGGTNNLHTLTEDTAGGTHRFETGGAFSLSLGNPYTCSAFVKAAGRTKVQMASAWSGSWSCVFDLTNGSIVSTTSCSATITPFGGGWYRITATATALGTSGGFGVYLHNGTSTSYTGDGVSGINFGYLQIEQSNFVSSYIPTTSGPVTRAGDTIGTIQASIINATSPEGTLLLNAAYMGYQGGTNDQIALCITNNSGSQKIAFSIPNFGAAAWGRIDLSGVGNINNGPAFTYGQSLKQAIAYKSGDSAYYVNGTKYGTALDTASFSGSLDSLQIGKWPSGYYPFFGWVKNITYYESRLPNTMLQGLTA